MLSEIYHSIILLLVLALSFLVVKTELADFTLQIIAVCFIIYFITKKVLKNAPKLLDASLFTFVVMIIVLTTGGLESPLLFLIFALIFALALVLEPIISVSITLTLIIFFILSLPPDEQFIKLLPLFALPFLTPFALFLGKEYEKNKKLNTSTQQTKQETLLFLSLVIKDHLKDINELAENSTGERELNRIKHLTNRSIELIEDYEKNN